uniref:Uncharacterized protein MANES_04G078800 n=1 Tax=Rhizophora mucronata TaxID=61149 RepID=A0A2P2L7E6_RHIMU
MSLTVASFAIIASSSCEDKSKESPVDNLPILKLSSFKRLGVENPCRKPTPYRSKTGIGILRSWKATSDTRNTSPMHAPLAWKILIEFPRKKELFFSSGANTIIIFYDEGPISCFRTELIMHISMD